MDHRVATAQSKHRETIVIGLFLSFFPVVLTYKAFFQPGYPFGGEVFSNLLPAVHARHSLSTGRLPIYTELFFSGRYQFINPLWYGFYPPGWLLFIPWTPLAIGVKILFWGHSFLTTAISYHYSNYYFDRYIAIPFALLWVMPIAAQFSSAHFEKIFAWPWVVLIAWQCVVLLDQTSAHSNEERFHRPGLWAGIGLGLILLAGGNYYFAYATILIGAVGFITWSKAFGWDVLKGSIIGTPHIIFSVLPVLLGGTDRGGPASGYFMQPFDVLDIVTGYYLTPFAYVSLLGQGYAVIGLPAALLAIYGLHYGYRYGDQFEFRWVVGISVAIVIGWALSTGTAYLYWIPGMDILRVTARSTILVAIGALVLAWYGIRSLNDRLADISPTYGRRIGQYIILYFLIMSLVISAGGWFSVAHFGDTKTPGPQYLTVAERLEKYNCDSAWIEVNPTEKVRPVSTYISSGELGYVLTRRGIAVRAVHYASFGQQWRIYDDHGELTFDALITGFELPSNGSIRLSKTDRYNPVGSINVSRFGLVDRVGNMRIYSTHGDCNEFN